MKKDGPFVKVATTLSERFGALTGAAVIVLDDRKMVVASNDRKLLGRPLAEWSDAGHDGCLRLPVQCGGERGEVIIAPPNNGEILSPRLAQTIIELVANQVMAVAGLANQRDLKNKFIHDLLQGRTGNEGDILRDAQILGMDFNRPRAVILIDVPDFIHPPSESPSDQQNESRIRRRAQSVIDSVVRFFTLPNDMICAYIGDSEVAVLKASTTQDLDPWTDPHDGRVSPSWADLKALKRAANELLEQMRDDTSVDVNIALGRYHPGIRGLMYSYGDARTALALGLRFHGANKVHSLDELGVAAFVGIADEGTKIDLARQLLSPLDAEPDLIKTLNIYFSTNCAPSLTSGELHIHRNTLTLRLNKIHSLTGLDPHKFDDIMLIRLAMLLRSA